MKWLLLLILFVQQTRAELAPRVMDQLAAQIPGISTGTTTPKQMHEAWDRYEAVVQAFVEESVKYRLLCYKALFQYEKARGRELYMIYGKKPEDVCDYFTKQVRSGYPVPEPHMIFNRIKNEMY